MDRMNCDLCCLVPSLEPNFYPMKILSITGCSIPHQTMLVRVKTIAARLILTSEASPSRAT